jgi:ankyrin repeat protein
VQSAIASHRRSAQDGSTPLFYAARNNKPSTLELLIRHGASLDAKDYVSAAGRCCHRVALTRLAQKGKTALDWAHAYGNMECVDILTRVSQPRHDDLCSLFSYVCLSVVD